MYDVSLGVVADGMKEDARKMVLTMVDMERSYLTADVFRDIISQNGATDGVEQPNLLRTLSGVWTGSICLVLSVFSYWQHVSVGCVIGVVRVLQDDMLPCVVLGACKAEVHARTHKRFLLAWQDCYASNFAVTVCSEHE